MHIVEIAVGGERCIDRCRAARLAEGGEAKRSWIGRGVAAVMVIRSSPASDSGPDDQRRRPAEMGQGGVAEGGALGERGGRQMNAADELPGLQDIGMISR